MESSHLVIFSTSGKFITKFNVLRYNREFKIPQRERQRQLQNLFLCFIANSKNLP